MVRRLGAVPLLAVIVLATACSSASRASPTSGEHAGHSAAELGGAPDVNGAPDRPVTGPQGRTPQFVVECEYSHAGTDDPIVHPGRPGESHLHVFFGNDSTDAFSTLGSLQAGETTCDQPLDRASYWAPALLRDGEMLTPVKSTAYYRPGVDVDPTTVQPYPAGLQMVAGNAAAVEPQSTAVVAWTCGTGIERAVTPPACPEGRDLRLVVTFPDCWDGEHLASDDHFGHVGYSSGGACPASLPVPIPQLQFSVEYPVTGSADQLELASGGLLTGHADFFNAWDEAKLSREVTLCLHRSLVCGVTSGKRTG